MQLNEMTNNLPLILTYIFPGLIFFGILKCFRGIELKGLLFVYAAIFSYILVILLRLIFPEQYIPVFACASAVVAGVLFCVLTFYGKDWLVKHFHKTCDTIWNDTLDYKNGSNLCIFMKDTPNYYIGQFVRKDDDWIVMEHYKILSIEDNYAVKDNTKIEQLVQLMLPISQIESIEVY